MSTITLHGYTLDDSQWKAKGGGGQCNIATKDGKQFFIKRLTKPRYPESDKFTGAFRQQKIDECNAWMKYRIAIIKALPGTGTGTLIKPIEYFREGPCYYEIANMVDVTSIPFDEIWKESKQNKARIMLTVATSLADVHKAGVIHGDLDPGNILISRAAGGNLVTKLIDFTDSFFEQNPPEAIMSKDFWWSPEVALYSKNSGQNHYREYISCKADVFSLGIVFHQYCSKNGQPPICTKPQPWQEFLSGQRPQIDPAIDPEFRELIASMLELEPADRPSMSEVHDTLRHILRPGSPSSGGNIDEERKKTEETQRKAIEETHLRTFENIGKRESNENMPAIRVGSGTRKGAMVVSAKLSERNPRKVELIFSDGVTQIMDLGLAKRLKFVDLN